MKKSIYSFMIQEDVIEEIDRMALKKGVSRSNLINEILAEYTAIKTVPKMTDEMMAYFTKIFDRKGSDLVPAGVSKTGRLMLKGTLDYKYRPTVKYEIDLLEGTLSFLYRSESRILVSRILEFLNFLMQTEKKYLKKKRLYELHRGCFVRSFVMYEDSYELFLQALSAYIGVFHTLLTGYIAENYSLKDVERLYKAYLSQKFGEI